MRQDTVITHVGWMALAGLSSAGLLASCAEDPPPVVERHNALGQTERCLSCHPAGARHTAGHAHPRIPGHEKLTEFGCAPCHGGRPLRLDAQAHTPRLGTGPDPFVPAAHAQMTCARCHVPGDLRGAQRLQLGRQAFLETTCVGCHHPGAHPRAIGLDLRVLAQRSPQFIARLLLAPRATHPSGAMWTVRDRTYGDHFADSPTGRRRMQALISYVLALGDGPQRTRHQDLWQLPKLRIDTPCLGCHRKPGAKKAAGLPHRCTVLRNTPRLRCNRCHGADDVTTAGKDASVSCPQIRAELFTCGTCHLRQNDGSRALVRAATAAP